MIRNFLYEVCKARGDWTMGDYKETAIRRLREKVGSGRVLLALSGGVGQVFVGQIKKITLFFFVTQRCVKIFVRRRKKKK